MEAPIVFEEAPIVFEEVGNNDVLFSKASNFQNIGVQIVSAPSQLSVDTGYNSTGSPSHQSQCSPAPSSSSGSSQGIPDSQLDPNPTQFTHITTIDPYEILSLKEKEETRHRKNKVSAKNCYHKRKNKVMKEDQELYDLTDKNQRLKINTERMEKKIATLRELYLRKLKTGSWKGSSK